MWRIAMRLRPEVQAPRIPGTPQVYPRWRVVQCWHVRGQQAFNLVKVERKNPARKRLILISPFRLLKGSTFDPLTILEESLRMIPQAQKLRLIELQREVAA